MSMMEGLVNVIVELFADLVLYSYIKQESAYLLGLVAVIGLAGLTLFFSRRLQAGRFPLLRGIDGVFDLTRNVEKAAESGKSLHFSLGTGGLGDTLTVQTLAGVDILREVSLKSAMSGPRLISTTASGLALPVQESTVRHAYDEVSGGTGYQAENVRFVAPTPTAYAAGVMRVLNSENVGFNVMAGAFGPEYLLMGEVGANRDARQLVASADPAVLPFVVATADYPVLGEELFALSSYLRPSPARIGSIMAQDLVRLVLVISILALAVAVSLSPEIGRLLGLGR